MLRLVRQILKHDYFAAVVAEPLNTIISEGVEPINGQGMVTSMRLVVRQRVQFSIVDNYENETFSCVSCPLRQ